MYITWSHLGNVLIPKYYEHYLTILGNLCNFTANQPTCKATYFCRHLSTVRQQQKLSTVLQIFESLAVYFWIYGFVPKFLGNEFWGLCR